jgi:hypothetical protein
MTVITCALVLKVGVICPNLEAKPDSRRDQLLPGRTSHQAPPVWTESSFQDPGKIEIAAAINAKENLVANRVSAGLQ